MTQAVRAIFENGVLRPIQPLKGVAEHSVVEILLKAIRRVPSSVSEVASENCWSSRPLDELAQAQGVQPVDDLTQLAADFWPEDESIDDFIAFVARDRRQDRESD